MTTIARTEKLLRPLRPGAEVEVEHHGVGHAWFNVREPNRFTAVEYRRGRGFGVSVYKTKSAWAGYGDQPARTFATLNALAEYLNPKRPPCKPTTTGRTGGTTPAVASRRTSAA